MAKVGAMLLFLALVLGLTAAGHYYVWARLVRDVAWPRAVHRLLTATIIGLYLSIPATFWLSRALPPNRGQGLLLFLYFWLGLAMGLPLLLGLADLLRGLFFASRAIAQLGDFGESRRLFLQRTLAASVGATALGLGIAGVLEARRAIAVRHLEVTLTKLPQSLGGFVIAQLTDLHIGPTLREDFVREVVERTNAIRPDIIAITGDLVDGSVEQLRSLVKPLENLRAKHGVFFVPGNHEYYSGVDEWVEYLPTLGIRVLRNERTTIGVGEDRFDLVGIDDEHASRVDPNARPDLEQALRGRDEDREIVLLAHQPKAIHRAVKHDVGLQLSGHTHGGQVWPFRWFVLLQQPIIQGLARFGRTALYVSPGTGYWGPPMRIGVPAEITRVVLRSGSEGVLV
ncbi:MAG: metallophosphoesterase [Polyangiaceae bacterium]